MGKFSAFDFICQQWRFIPPVLNTDLSGKNVVVVGANTGLGLEATKHFARMNPARLILACRNPDKGKAAVTAVEQATGFNTAELWLIDLAKFSSVIEFADKFEKSGARLDILVMNAAIASHVYETTPDGWESMIAVNHLSTSLLSILLLPRMIQTAQEFSTTPRLVIVGSDVHHWTKIGNDVITTPSILKTVSSKEYCTPTNMRSRYFFSKLLNVLFVRAFAAHLSSSPVTINVVNPGFAYSELRRNMRGIMGWLNWIAQKALALTSEQASRMLVRAAIWDKSEEEFQGAYLSTECISEPSDYVLSEDGQTSQERIWKETIDILAEVDPKIRIIVDNYTVVTSR